MNDEQPIQQIRHEDHLAVVQREPQVRDACVEVIGESLHGRWQRVPVRCVSVTAPAVDTSLP